MRLKQKYGLRIRKAYYSPAKMQYIFYILREIEPPFSRDEGKSQGYSSVI